MIPDAPPTVSPDYLGIWIRLERLTRYVIGRRMQEGTTPESDARPGDEAAPTDRARVGN
jgi:hypothetical protein